jgi:hypothetical protein
MQNSVRRFTSFALAARHVWSITAINKISVAGFGLLLNPD